LAARVTVALGVLAQLAPVEQMKTLMALANRSFALTAS
jgi:hypothetical protein